METEETLHRDNSQKKEKNINETQANTKKEEAKSKKKSSIKPLIVGGIAAAAMGAGVAYASDIETFNFGEETDNNESSNNDSNINLPENVKIAESVTDDMSFNEAFAAARAEVGVGGVFEWNGEMYNTFTAEEWNSMSPQERHEFFENYKEAIEQDSNDNTGTSNQSETNTANNETATGGDLANNQTETNTANNGTATGSDLANNQTETNTSIEHIVEPYVEDIEVIAINHDVDFGDGEGIIAESVATVNINGETVYMADVDGDGAFDGAANDFGEIDMPNTNLDITSAEEDLMLNMMASQEGNDGFDDMPDYINDADICDFA